MIVKIHKAHKTHQSIVKTSWKNPANILRTSRKHQEDMYRISRKNPKKLWLSENICEHLTTSEHILNTSENLYRIFVINWGHPENIWKQLRTSENISRTSENISGTFENISGTSENIWHPPEKKCSHRGWLCIAQGVVMHKSYNWYENIGNSWEHRKTYKIIWYQINCTYLGHRKWLLFYPCPQLFHHSEH